MAGVGAKGAGNRSADIVSESRNEPLSSPQSRRFSSQLASAQVPACLHTRVGKLTRKLDWRMIEKED